MESDQLIFDKKRLRVKKCPCGKNNRDGKFVPFIGYDDCGYCHSCCQSFYPNHETAKNKFNAKVIYAQSKRSLPNRYSTTPYEQLIETRHNYGNNNFVQFLLTHFDFQTVEQIIVKYNLGSLPTIPRATVFWQVDQVGTIRGGKIMVYDPLTGRRKKEPYTKISWVHSCKKQSDYILRQCFFGEHLISIYPSKRIAIVESEKSAIIASIHFPQFNWIASGGCHISQDKMKAIAGSNVILFPDADKYKEWLLLANRYKHLVNAQVSDFLEINTTDEEKKTGVDIADFLLPSHF